MSGPVAMGAPFEVQPHIRLVDSAGETVPVSGHVVMASLAGGPDTTGMLLPSQNCYGVSVMGHVYFNGLFAAGTPGNYKLNFTSVEVGHVTHAVNLIEPMAFKPLVDPTGIAIARAASDSKANSVFSTQPRVRLVNSSGSTVPLSGYQIVASVSGGSGTLLPTANCTVATVAGFSNYTGLYVDQAGTYTLNFNLTGVGNDNQTLNIS